MDQIYATQIQGGNVVEMNSFLDVDELEFLIHFGRILIINGGGVVLELGVP